MADIDKNSGRAVIEGDSIVIRIAIEALPMVVEGMWAAGYSDVRYKVIDAAVFAKELVHELDDESGDGSTRVHRMFDSAIGEAINQGAQGIDEHEDQGA